MEMFSGDNIVPGLLHYERYLHDVYLIFKSEQNIFIGIGGQSVNLETCMDMPGICNYREGVDAH